MCGYSQKKEVKMPIDRIESWTNRIFNNTATEQNVRRESYNPFKKSNFQKNILMEDVFQSSKNNNSEKLSFTGNLTKSSKRIYSTFVGSITNFGNKIQEGIEAINAFGTRMKDSIVNTWHKINEIGNREVNLDGIKNVLNADVSSLFGRSREKEIAKMAKLEPHAQIKPMLKEALSALEADLAVAA